MLYARYNGALADHVEADEGMVYVRMRRQVPTVFLTIMGINTMWIYAEATARPRYGVERAEG